jgi:uncharacterized cofD-like protein
LDIVGQVRTSDGRILDLRGQSRVAVSPDEVVSVRLDPPQPTASPDAVQAILDADAVVLGPGSWFTSVLPHLLVPGLREALETTAALKILTLNLNPQLDAETSGLPLARHLDVVHETAPALVFDIVLADPAHAGDAPALRAAAANLGAELAQAPLAEQRRPGRHSRDLYARALADLLPRTA